MTPDPELLRRFAQAGDQTAFGELARRYMDLVYSVAVRVTNNGALAEDVTQTVFTKLARQPEKLTGYDTLVGWLHTTTRHAAINVVRGEERRRVHEQEASTMQDHATELAVQWEQIGPVLDEAVDALPEDDRKAVLLRFFSGLSHQEVGTVLGLSEEAARKRVERALERLRGGFARRGITVSSLALGAAIQGSSVQAAPAELVANVTKAALAGAGGGVAGGALFATLFMSLKTKVGVTAVLIVALGAWLAVQLQSPAALEAAPKIASAPKAPVGAVAPPAPVMPRRSEPPIASGPSVVSSPPSTVLVVSPVSAAGSFSAGPKADLNSAISTALHFLDTQDDMGFFKTIMPPRALGDGENQWNTVEDFAARVRQAPGSAARMAAMQQALHALQSETPTLNAEGTRATYKFEPPVAGYKAVIFVKEGEFWYLNGM